MRARSRDILRVDAARGLGAVALALLLAAATPAAEPPLAVVVDPGHGGSDFGARGPAGALEKDLVLAIARRTGEALAERGVRVVYTREKDVFVTLAERTEIANRARADLFLSIHANSAPDPDARGSETYFLSEEASDEEALRTALAENEVFRQEGTAADSADVVGSILGDMIRSDHLQRSSRVAAGIQRGLARLPVPSRGVKQAPFAVLSGVNMPAVLVEVGFLSHADEERRLRARDRQTELARAIASAVHTTLEAGASASAEEKP
jgi:N-acetylmuramoyl-L-alanine amidase